MKKISFIAMAIIFTITFAFADYRITRGPDIGEIYFIGPTVTQPAAIYHSTDFGETATCMDSTLNTNINFMSITADLTTGVLYGYAMPENLYVSFDYGQEGSWEFISNGGHWCINSGKNEGEIYDSFSKHSEDYGVNFIQHSANGFFGSSICTEIDNENNIGYINVSNYPIIDSLWLLITYDNFENLEIQHVFNDYIGTNILTRGYYNGELYLYRKHNLYGKTLLYSIDYGETWELKNTFNCPNLPIKGIVGGRQPGEMYMIVEYVQLLSTIKHTYIYHSLDYGETFTIYHTFEYGPEPYYANFIATPDSGNAPLTVQLTDISNGAGGLTWEWDFDDDGIIDSYEQNPEYTYQDSGMYRVTLQILNGMYDPELIASKYIHVSINNGIDNEEQVQIPNVKLGNYPNPFNPTTTISFSTTEITEDTETCTKWRIIIYNVRGQKVDELEISNQQTAVSWNAESMPSGIYLYKLNLSNSKIKKMLLMK